MIRKNSIQNVCLAAAACLSIVACGDNAMPAKDPSSSTATTTTPTSEPNGSSMTAQGPQQTPAQSTMTTSPMTTTPANNGVPVGAVGNSTTSGSNAPVANNPGTASGTTDATNTKVNDRDRASGVVTPMNQGNNKSDIDITAEIRRAVVGDGSLSFNAKNVKIITEHGKVTLRGPVKSDAERDAIAAKAKATAGVSSVDNQLEIKK